MHARHVSETFLNLAQLEGDGSISLWDVEQQLGQEGAPLIVLFLSIPFAFPMPIPGVSQTFGLAMFLLVRRIVWQKNTTARLPRFLGERHISRPLVRKAGAKGHVLFSKVEHLLHPRWPWFSQGMGRFLAGMAIALAAVALAIPFPPVVPLTNTVPAMAIAILALGLVTRDGIAILVGHLAHIGSWVYLATVAGVLVAATVAVWNFLVKWWDVILQWVQTAF